ncbi:MAG: hypothetical protein V2I76_08780, partial [Roseobacter sp.]|nr:hypothetical protein [Roseobacter sp.]
RDRHGVAFPDFDYSRLERGEITDLPRDLTLAELLDVRNTGAADLAAAITKGKSNPSLSDWVAKALPAARAACSHSPATSSKKKGRTR